MRKGLTYHFLDVKKTNLLEKIKLLKKNKIGMPCTQSLSVTKQTNDIW